MQIKMDCHGAKIVIAAAALSASAIACSAQERVLYNFPQPQSRGAWVNVNDGVMGGVSRGQHGYTSEGALRFFGNLSTANNGGFASVRSQGRQLGLQPGDELRIKARGDGRMYNVDLRIPGNRMAFTYRVTIRTQANQWQEFRIPLRLFSATSFGRPVANAQPLNTTAVNSVGFTLSDKKQGPFQIDVESIRVARAGTK